MKLFLVRHGIAIEGLAPGMQRDSERTLTDEGRAEMKLVARGLRQIGARPQVVLSSPYVRTRQTAEIFANEFDVEIKFVDALAPGVNFSRLCRALSDAGKYEQIMLVGHEPDMGMIAGQFLFASDGFEMPFKKGAVCRIDVSDLPPTMPGVLKWYMPPKIFQRLS
jgi:phosphohistidine phosphatase